MLLVRVFTAVWMLVGLAYAQPSARPFTVAHRGGMARQPQNTMAAFRHAVREGIDLLEFDMVVTKDDQIVIHHDLEVHEPLCQVPGSGSKPAFGPIRLLSLEETRRFDCGSWSNPQYPAQVTIPGEHMPTLDEFLGEFAGSRVRFLAETKMAADRDATFIDPAKFIGLVLRSLARHPVYDRFVLQSGDYRTIDEMRRREQRVAGCLLNVRRFKPDYVKISREHHARYLMVGPADITAAQIGALHGAGVRVMSNTVADRAGWQRCLEMGMDGLMSDDPDELMRFVRSR